MFNTQGDPSPPIILTKDWNKKWQHGILKDVNVNICFYSESQILTSSEINLERPLYSIFLFSSKEEMR